MTRLRARYVFLIRYLRFVLLRIQADFLDVVPPALRGAKKPKQLFAAGIPQVVVPQDER